VGLGGRDMRPRLLPLRPFWSQPIDNNVCRLSNNKCRICRGWTFGCCRIW